LITIKRIQGIKRRIVIPFNNKKEERAGFLLVSFTT
jgi:hypothetical protein